MTHSQLVPDPLESEILKDKILEKYTIHRYESGAEHADRVDSTTTVVYHPLVKVVDSSGAEYTGGEASLRLSESVNRSRTDIDEVEFVYEGEKHTAYFDVSAFEELYAKHQ